MQPIKDEVFKQISWDGWQNVRFAKKDRIVQSTDSKSAWDVVPGPVTYPVISSNHQSGISIVDQSQRSFKVSALL